MPKLSRKAVWIITAIACLPVYLLVIYKPDIGRPLGGVAIVVVVLLAVRDARQDRRDAKSATRTGGQPAAPDKPSREAKRRKVREGQFELPKSSMRRPKEPHVLLPVGESIEVVSMENHAGAIADALKGSSERKVFAELYASTQKRRRRRQEVVGIRIDDQQVGELSPSFSVHFLPLLELCEERGLKLFCGGTVSGSKPRGEVVLEAARLGILSDDWLQENIYRIPVLPDAERA